MFFIRMARNTKRKLAIFAGTSKCLIYAEAKFCASEMPGEIKYYECSRTEYCCAFGCCVSPGLHFHHLWYYWILVIIMFLVCSGGGWWYRYWLQGRYRAAASAIPSRPANTRSQSSTRGPTCQAQRARITYNSARNTVLLHRPQRNGAAPAYNGNAAASSHYQNMSVVLNDANCPYYQLYGPPPSYETVIAQSRGKLSNPASPESTSSRPNPTIPQCFSYTCNTNTRLNNPLDQSMQYQNGNASPRQHDNHDSIPYAHYPQFCTSNGLVGQSMCVPFEYQEQSFVPADSFNRPYHTSSKGYVTYPPDKPSDTSNPDNTSYELTNMEGYTMMSIDTAASSSREENPWEPKERTISKVHGKPMERGRLEKNRGQPETQDCPNRISPISSTFLHTEDHEAIAIKSAASSSKYLTPQRDLWRERRVYGGSFKMVGRYAGRPKFDEYSVQRAFLKCSPRSCETFIGSSENTPRITNPLSVQTINGGVSSPSESNPSNNVILESFASDGTSPSTAGVDVVEVRRTCLTKGSTNFDVESKHRLDRSKSLD